MKTSSKQKKNNKSGPLPDIIDKDHWELVVPGGPFSEFPGAVVLVVRDGTVSCANDQAELLCKFIRRGGSEEYLEALKSAFNGKAAQVNPLLIRAERDERSRVLAAFDLALLPWDGGQAALLLGRNITLERNLRAALIESRQRYRDLLEASCDFAWETNAEGYFSFVTPDGGLGYTAAEISGMQADGLLVDVHTLVTNPFSCRAPCDEEEVWVKDSYGDERCLLITSMPLWSDQEAWHGNRGFCRDITDQRKVEMQRAEEIHRERVYNRILEIARSEMVPVKMLGSVATCLIPALPVDAVMISHFDGEIWHAVAEQGSALPLDAIARVQAALKMGETVYQESGSDGVLVAVSTKFRGQANGAICLWRRGANVVWSAGEGELLERIQIQIGISLQQYGHHRDLQTLSSTDPLTGLLNRRRFEYLLTGFIEDHNGDEHTHLLLYLDMDNFKYVNDAYGHQEGDKALRDFAEVLKQETRRHDWLARLGGDEFAIFLPNVPEEEASSKARAILMALEPALAREEDPEWRLGASIGGYLFTARDGTNIADLFLHADEAMYRVKRSGKNGIYVVKEQLEGAGS
ncbi:sensor domain-containing diguanylate cyclase [Kiloniella laminariae]|uniref:sensor domain-containing diguanylate cyclase n=1 Tax=Kiloniella laminariae TaxID=454162 RepID=UPI00037CB157|nr:sensor domain-containing diguanylate cyclase [Kiloniella laminariae]